MELGIHIFDFNYPDQPASIAPTLARAGQAAEAAGVTWISVMDHYFQMEATAPAEHPMLECYTALGYLAGHTSSAQLGVLVTGVTYRYPGLLAKAVTTLDVLSEGRAVLGIGAAWYDREHRGLGVPFPPTAERFERLEEALQIALQMWDADNDGAYQGKHYQLAETLCVPRPISRPHPPIMIGGSGERKTLRLVAQYADACNLFGASGVDEISHKLDVLRRHCDDVGRDYSEIRKTMLYGGTGIGDGGDAFLEEMVAFAKVGIDQVIVMPPFQPPDQWIEQNLTGLAPRLAEL